MNAPLVSVVMIFKDAAPFLQEAAGSVLAQTYAPLELLLVDDGGTDGSDALAAAVVASAPDRARLLSSPGRVNRGMSAARALGVEHARGELVAFLDADDRWDPGHLAHDVALLQAHPEAGMVCGRAWSWGSWDAGADRPDRLLPLAFPPGSVVPPPRLLAAVLRQGALATPTCNLLVRAQALRDSGGPVAAFTGMYEDQVLNSLLQLSVPAVMSGATHAWYRQHDGSATAAALREGTFARVGANDSRRRFLEWLDGRPELDRATADPELRLLLDRSLEEQRAAPVRRGVRGTAAALARRAATPRVKRAAKELLLRRGLVRVRLGSLSVLEPASRQFGLDRGVPVDRYYIEDFLGRWAEDVHGRVLEAGDSAYTERFGAARVERAEVLNVYEGAPGTTFVADLTDGVGLPDDAFDCVVLTQTLQMLFDVHAAARTLRRILKPGGVLLLTVPGITPVSNDVWATTWHWSFTQHSARRLFEEVFGPDAVQVDQFGNVVSAVAFLQGLAADEVPARTLDAVDEQFPVIVAVRAVRPVAS